MRRIESNDGVASLPQCIRCGRFLRASRRFVVFALPRMFIMEEQCRNSLQAMAPTGHRSGAQAFHPQGQDLKTGDRNGARSELATLVQTVERQHQVRADIGKLQTGLATNDLQAARQALSGPAGHGRAASGAAAPGAGMAECRPRWRAVFAGGRTAFTTLLQGLNSGIGGSAPPALSPAKNVTAEPGPRFPGICPASILSLGLHFGGRRFGTLLTAATKSLPNFPAWRAMVSPRVCTTFL